MEKTEKRTETVLEPRKGSGHPGIDPHLPDKTSKPKEDKKEKGDKK